MDYPVKFDDTEIPEPEEDGGENCLATITYPTGAQNRQGWTDYRDSIRPLDR